MDMREFASNTKVIDIFQLLFETLSYFIFVKLRVLKMRSSQSIASIARLWNNLFGILLCPLWLLIFIADCFGGWVWIFSEKLKHQLCCCVDTAVDIFYIGAYNQFFQPSVISFYLVVFCFCFTLAEFYWTLVIMTF